MYHTFFYIEAFCFQPIPYEGNWPWCSKEENGLSDKRYRYTLTSLSNPRRCIGFARRRMGRGGRIILDRAHHDLDDFWRTVDFTIYEPSNSGSISGSETIKTELTDNRLVTTTTTTTNSMSDVVAARLNCSYSNSGGDDRLRTSGVLDGVTVKSEPIEVKEEAEKMVVDVRVGGKEDEDDMMEFLKTVRKEW